MLHVKIDTALKSFLAFTGTFLVAYDELPRRVALKLKSAKLGPGSIQCSQCLHQCLLRTTFSSCAGMGCGLGIRIPSGHRSRAGNNTVLRSIDGQYSVPKLLLAVRVEPVEFLKCSLCRFTARSLRCAAVHPQLELNISHLLLSPIGARTRAPRSRHPGIGAIKDW